MHIHVNLHLVERTEGSNFLPSCFLRRDLLLAFPFKIAFQIPPNICHLEMQVFAKVELFPQIPSHALG